MHFSWSAIWSCLLGTSDDDRIRSYYSYTRSVSPEGGRDMISMHEICSKHRRSMPLNATANRKLCSAEVVTPYWLFIVELVHGRPHQSSSSSSSSSSSTSTLTLPSGYLTPRLISSVWILPTRQPTHFSLLLFPPRSKACET